MQLPFPALHITFTSHSPLVEQMMFRWRGNWQGQNAAATPTLEFHLHQVNALPGLPETTLLFMTQTPAPLTIYQGKTGGLWLVFPEGGLVELHTHGAVGRAGQAWVTTEFLHSGRFEDLLWVALAPLLRQVGLFLAHGFAAASPDQAQTILLVGRSGSGKTTTGLALLEAGWHYLANDVVLLQTRPDGVYALPTPGDIITVRPKTLDLLPGLRPQTHFPPGQKGQVQVHKMACGWGKPGRVTTVYFPHVAGVATTIRPLSKAIAWSKLMEESVDRWDAAALPAHLELLSQLTQQARLFDLRLGPDVGELMGTLGTQRNSPG